MFYKYTQLGKIKNKIENKLTVLRIYLK